MDLRRLRYFIAIAESGSLTEAARRLHIVQPALSQRLAGLEADLGVQLLVRGNKGVTLTPAGVELYGRALIIVKHLDAARLAVKEKAGEAEGAVTIGVLRSMAPVLGKRLFLTLKERLPRVTPVLRTGYSAVLHRMLMEGRLDIAMQVVMHDTAGVEILYSEHLYAAGVPALLGNENAPIDLAQLRNMPILLAGRQSTHTLLVQAAKREGVHLNVVGDIEDSPSLLEICDTGTAVTFLAEKVARKAASERGLTIRRLDHPSLVRHVAIQINPDIPLTATITAVKNIVAEILTQPMPESGNQDEMLA